MTEQWSVPVWVAVALLLVLLAALLTLATALARSRATARRQLSRARADAESLESLRDQVEQIERRLAASSAPTTAEQREYVITGLGDGSADEDAPSTPRVEAPLFADLVLRETVVQAASLAHGLRRALAPEARNRIRFEMRRELKRARKQRRADLREARRDWEARQRAGVDTADSAA